MGNTTRLIHSRNLTRIRAVAQALNSLKVSIMNVPVTTHTRRKTLWDIGIWAFDSKNTKLPSKFGKGYAAFMKVTRGSIYKAKIQLDPASRCEESEWATLPQWAKVRNESVSDIPGHLWVTPMKTLITGELLAQKKCCGARYALFHNSAEGFFEADPDGYTRPPKTFTPSDLEAFSKDAKAATLGDTDEPESAAKAPTPALVTGLTPLEVVDATLQVSTNVVRKASTVEV